MFTHRAFKGQVSDMKTSAGVAVGLGEVWASAVDGCSLAVPQPQLLGVSEEDGSQCTPPWRLALDQMGATIPEKWEAAQGAYALLPGAAHSQRLSDTGGKNLAPWPQGGLTLWYHMFWSCTWDQAEA